MQHEFDSRPPSPVRRLLDRAAWVVQIGFLAAAIGVVGYAAVPLFRHGPASIRPVSTMEAVDWSSTESSVYCLACHKEVAQSADRLDVKHGHSANVALNAAQLETIKAMGTTSGEDGVLICISCHKLGNGNPDMLGETLAGSKLCKGCHPEQFTTVGTPHDLRITAPDEKNRIGLTAETGGPCSACHLSHHYARDFEPSVLDPDGRCVTCHKIGRAAAKHARPTMEHPDAHCVVCHNPHDATHSNFLKKPGAEVCNDCHGEFAAGKSKGMHPVGELPYPVPQALIDAGAQTLGNPRQITCLTCHSTHSSTHKPLLIMPADTNDLCLACHDKELAAKSPDGRLPRHGQSPRMTEKQRAVVEGRGGRTGADGELLCLSCHEVHHAPVASDLLAFLPAAEDGCSACHAEQAGVVGTAHDLRTRFAAEKNLAGVTPAVGGPCSACHMAHGPGRAPNPTDADVSGQCMNCHAPGKLGGMPEGHASIADGHPGTNCVACHNPHAHETRDFLARPEAELCKSCHAKQFSLAGGPHDPAHRPDAWSKVPGGAEGQGPCLTCHAAHGKKGTGLFGFDAVADGNHDSACLHCHSETAWNAPTDLAAIHPQKINPDQKRVPVALVPHDEKGNPRMGCRTCHDPHGAAEPAHLARVEAGEPTAALCLHCHEDKKLIEMTGHSTAKLAAAGFSTDSCKPCHAMHARPQDAWGQMLSPRFLTQADGGTGSEPTGTVSAAQAAGTQPAAYAHEAAVPCLVCHHAGGPAPVRDVATHPPVTLVNLVKPGEPGYMPLFGEDGKVSENGQITCRTCHLSHGQTELLAKAAQNGELSADESQSARMQLRPFVAPNICTQCHGAQGRLKFLFFHNLEQRKTN